VLLSDRSKVMVRNYRRLARIEDAQPERDLTCLKCHSMDAHAARAGNRLAVEDGIGCERCHGPAERWLSRHYGHDWPQLSAARKADLGFTDLKDLTVRARLCVECHVGTGDQPVDHDLYAAGHPRLVFEYSSFLATMPPHWNVRQERQRYPDLEARLWLIGQVVCAHESLKLLASRAANDRAPWPEFAEYDCYACHHDLKADSGRPKRGFGGQVPGLLPWNTWYTAMLPFARSSDGTPLVSPDLRSTLAALGQEMAKPLPQRDVVARQAQEAARELGQRMVELGREKTYRVSALREMFATIASQDPKARSLTWDDATQRYLALAALYHTMTDLDPSLRNTRVRKELHRLARPLRFPARMDSPRRFDGAQFLQQLETLGRQLGR
jgi:hypothetical protein